MLSLFGRSRRGSGVSVGATYAKDRTSTSEESAEVLAVRPDPLGIPHVRFKLKAKRPTGTQAEDRTLSISAFRERYPVEVKRERRSRKSKSV